MSKPLDFTEASLLQYVERYLRRQGVLRNASEWLYEGWGFEGPPTPEQYAAALLMEARDQDGAVKRGESDASWPAKLREMAFHIIGYCHNVKIG